MLELPRHLNFVAQGNDVNYIFQGAGTALGELPPYFMARAARLSGADLDDDEFEEIEELIHEKKEHPEELVKTY